MQNTANIEPFDIQSVSQFTYSTFQNLKTTSANPNVPYKIYEMTNNNKVNQDFYTLANYSKEYTTVENMPSPSETNKKQDEIINALDSIGCCIHLVVKKNDIENIENITAKRRLIKARNLAAETVKYYKNTSKKSWVSKSIY
jgi:hypothetical protein